MGWQDRDYAQGRPPPPRYGFGRGRGATGFLIGGSIVTTIIAINGGIFALEAVIPAFKVFTSKGYGVGTAHGTFVFGWLDLVPALVLKGQVWRLFTAQYLHANFMHIFFNMLCLHFLGRLFEQRWSPRKFLVIYTLCGLAGNVFYTVLAITGALSPWTPAVGASGCIYGLLGMVAVWYPNLQVYIMGVLPVRARTLAIILALVAFFSVQTRGANYGGEACHLAGMVFGVLWAARGDQWWATSRWALRSNRSSRSDRFKPKTKGGGFFGARRRSSKGFTEQVAERRVDAEAIDRILKKVHDKGIHSLSESEKRVLREVTERQRLREAEMGRADKL